MTGPPTDVGIVGHALLGSPIGPAVRDHLRSRRMRPSFTTWVVLSSQASAILLQAVAMPFARDEQTANATLLIIASLALTYASVIWAVTNPGLTRVERNVAVICLGLTTALQFRLKNPLFLLGFDEQLHWRTLRDIQASHGIFQTNPLLPVSSRYPGLEAITALINQIGVPTLAAALIVVLLSRLVLVTVLCDAVERLTGNMRAGGLAVAVYAVSDQFVVFISQYAYQTLALPLALAAVSLVARARWVRNPWLLLSGAAVCLLAVVVTHHVTNTLTAAFLCVWAVFQRGSIARWRVLFAAITAVVLTVAWMTLQWSRLREYFAPIVEYTALLIVGNHRRELFSDNSGSATPAWEQAFLLYYAAAICVVVAYLVFVRLRVIVHRTRRRLGSRLQPWYPPTLLVIIVALIPPILAARVLPNSGETIARAPGFLFLPLSFLVAACWLHRHRTESRRHSRARHRTRSGLLRTVGILGTTAVFIGGFLLGSGPDWLRLPGSYLVSADSRSMDGQALAAAAWAGGNLPGGSRVGADRVSSVLLSSQANLWPVTEVGDVSVSSLFFADRWGAEQTELVRRLHLKYLYVDERLATSLPHVGSYFLTVRPEESGRRLTEGDLSKFNQVADVKAVYRRGPISIYDLGALSGGEMRTGFFNDARSPGTTAQLLAGLLMGLLLATVFRRPAGRVILEVARSYLTEAGPALAMATAVAFGCAAAVLEVYARVWVGPAFFFTATTILVLIFRREMFVAARRARQMVSIAWVLAFYSFAIVIAAGVMLAAWSALSAAQV